MIEISLVISFGYMVYNILQQSKWLYWPSTTLWPHTSQHTSSPLVVVMRLAHIFMGSAIKFKDSKADFQEHCNCPPLVAHTPHTPTHFPAPLKALCFQYSWLVEPEPLELFMWLLWLKQLEQTLRLANTSWLALPVATATWSYHKCTERRFDLELYGISSQFPKHAWV